MQILANHVALVPLFNTNSLMFHDTWSSTQVGCTKICIPENLSGKVSIHFKHFSIDSFCSMSSMSCNRTKERPDDEPVDVEWRVPSDNRPLLVTSLFRSVLDVPEILGNFVVWFVAAFRQCFSFSSLLVQVV